MLDESNSQLTLKFTPKGTSTGASQYNVCTGLHDLLSVKLFSSLIQGINATCDICIYHTCLYFKRYTVFHVNILFDKLNQQPNQSDKTNMKSCDNLRGSPLSCIRVIKMAVDSSIL